MWIHYLGLWMQILPLEMKLGNCFIRTGWRTDQKCMDPMTRQYMKAETDRAPCIYPEVNNIYATHSGRGSYRTRQIKLNLWTLKASLLPIREDLTMEFSYSSKSIIYRTWQMNWEVSSLYILSHQLDIQMGDTPTHSLAIPIQRLTEAQDIKLEGA